MKVLIASAVLALAAAFALKSGGEEATQGQDSTFQQGLHRMDSVLQQGLNEETHDEFTQQADSSVRWLRGLSVSVQGAAD